MSQSLSSWTDEFRDLWIAGTAPSVEQFISKRGSIPAPQLAELVIIDQAFRWEADNSPTAEEYFTRFPALLNERESAIDLVFSEFLLRERLEQRPVIDEYLERFPQFTEELRRQDAFHRAMGNGVTDSGLRDDGFGTSSADQPVESVARLLTVPGYEIESELGRGGIGAVYKARHVQLNRTVALKLLLAGNFASPNLLRRFLVEAEATARLQHPHIVQIYEVGQYDGHPFLALEYVNGGTLSQWTRGQPQSPRDAASIIQTLAETVQFAHEHGVVHRDLKPGNVLIQRLSRSRNQDKGPEIRIDSSLPGKGVNQGGSAITAVTALKVREDADEEYTLPRQIFHSGLQLKIADFGLAKLLVGGSDADLGAATMSGDILGTAAYMSPEQARGDTTQLTAVTDVYSLGAMLYELLTGRPPFVGVQPLEVLGQVLTDEPVRPSHLVRRLPNDIQTICLKCLEKSPARRYGSAGELAEDLSRFLNDQPIVARHTSKMERSWRWCRRHPVKTSIAASIATILILVAAISSAYSIKLGHQLTLTSQAKNREQSAKFQALNQLWESKLAQADAIRTSNQVGQRYDALNAIEVARELGDSIRFSTEQIDRMRNATIACLAHPDIRVVSECQGDFSRSNPVATVNRLQSIYACLQSSDSVVVRRTFDGEQIGQVAVSDPESIPLLSEDGKRLAILNDNCRVYAIDTNVPKLIFETPSQGTWNFSPDGSRILGTNGDGQLSLIDLSDASVIRTYGPIRARNDIAISPDGKRAAVYDGNSVQVIELDSGQISLRIDSPQIRGRNYFAWHPNSNYLAIGPFVFEGIELWDVANNARLNTFFHDTGDLKLSFSSTGERLLSYDAWGVSLIVWNVSSGEIELSRVGIGVHAITADETGGFRLFQLPDDGQMNALTIEHPRIYYTLPLIRQPGSAPSSHDLAYSPDGRLLAAVIRGDLQIFDARKFLELDRLACGHCYIRFDPDGSLLTSNSPGLGRWTLSADELLNGGSTGHFKLGPPVYLSDSVAYSTFDVSQDGQIIAISTGNQVRIHSPTHSEIVQSIGPHQDIRRLSISPDGRRIVTGGWAGGKACVWDIDSGKLLHTFDEPDCCLVQFSPDGKWLVTNSDRVRVWNATTWSHVADISVTGSSVKGVQTCFSPDGRLLAVSDSSARINLCDPASGRKLIVLTDPNEHFVIGMVFNPDGSQLAVLSSGARGGVHVWELAAIRDELRKRKLDWPADETTPLEFENSGPQKVNVADLNYSISGLRIVPDQRFVEIDARQCYDLLRKAAEKFDVIPARSAIAKMIKLQPRNAFVCNNFAWLLATGPHPLRDSAIAVEFARRAISDESLSASDRALYSNTLGVALYRDNKIEEAIGILEQSLAIQPPASQAFDLYFLSMCSSRLGDQEKAREYFDRAESLVRHYESQMSNTWRTELALFADEAQLVNGSLLPPK